MIQIVNTTIPTWNPCGDFLMVKSDDWDSEEAGRDGCFKKHLAILRRLHVKTSHEEIRELCHLWGCRDLNDFWQMMNELDDESLFSAVMEAVRRVKARKNAKEKKKEVIAAYD